MTLNTGVQGQAGRVAPAGGRDDNPASLKQARNRADNIRVESRSLYVRQRLEFFFYLGICLGIHLATCPVLARIEAGKQAGV